MARRNGLKAWLLLHARKAEVRGCQATTLGVRAVKYSRTCEHLLVIFFLVWVSIVLFGSGSAESDPAKGASSSDCERPEQVPRNPTGAHTCAVVYTRVSCVPLSREREKRLAAEGEELADAGR